MKIHLFIERAPIGILTGVTAGLIVGCATSDDQIAKALRNNPKIILEVIEENPDQVIEVLNKAARKAQEIKREKQISDLKGQQQRDIESPKQPALLAGRRLLGSASSPITIVEYADFQCPACRMAYNSLRGIKQKYRGQVQFYFKHMPLNFHARALPAAKMFEAAKIQGSSKALDFYNEIFDNQKSLENESFLLETAKKLGLNTKKLEKDMQSSEVAQAIAEDMKEFENFGFTGTPVLIVNGVAMQGAQPADEIERIILETSKNRSK